MQTTHISLPTKELKPVITKAVKSKAFRAWFVPMNDGVSVSYIGGTNGETNTYEEVFLPGIYGGDYAFQVNLKALKSLVSDKRSETVKVNLFGDPGSAGIDAAKTFKVGHSADSLEAYRKTLDERSFTSIGIVESGSGECANPQDFLSILKAWVPWLKTAYARLQLIELRLDESGITALASDGHGLAKLRLAGSATHSTWFRASIAEAETEDEGDEIVIHLPLKAVERLVDVASLVKGVTDIAIGLTDDRRALQVNVGNHLNLSTGKTLDYREVSWSRLSFDCFDGRKPDLMGVLEMYRKALESEPEAYLTSSLDDRFERALSDALAYRRTPAKVAKDLKCDLYANDIMLFLCPVSGVFGDDDSLEGVSAAHQHIRHVGRRKLAIHLYNSVSIYRSDVNFPESVQAMMTVPCDNPDKALGSKGRFFRIVANDHSQAKLYSAIAATLSILPSQNLITDGELIALDSVPGAVSFQVLVKPQLVQE
jgi:hypothetical protein